MKNLFNLYLLITLLGILSPIYSQWSKFPIDPYLPDATIIDIADIDGDGDLDMAANGSPYVRWYQNNSPNPTWTIYNIDNSLEGAVGIAIVDIDGDSTLDVVASGYNSSDIRWYRNEGGTTITWHRYIIDDNFYGAEFLRVDDIDADGDPDVAVTSTFGNSVAWYENNLPNTNWSQHKIDDGNLGGARNVEIGDIDDDDDLDLVVTGTFADDLVWYENNLSDTSWDKHIIDGSLDGAWGICIADIDGDSTMDVVSTGLDADNVVWYKTDDAGQTWTKHIIDDSLDGARNVNVADIDDDGDLDVVAVAFNADQVVWYENQLPNWPKDTIDTDLDAANYVCTANIDGDDYFDVVATGRLANVLVWYEQEPVWVKTVEIFPKYLIPEGDTLFIKAFIGNPENYSVSVYAKIDGMEVSFSDSLPLFDDGMHFDENPNDNIWGNAKWYSGLEEDMYSVKTYTHVFIAGSFYQDFFLNYFTTGGPLTLDSISYMKGLLDWYYIRPFVHNNASTMTFTDVKVRILCNDPWVSSIAYSLVNLPDIPPGETVGASSQCIIGYIDSLFPGHFNIKTEIIIYGWTFWMDSMQVIVGVENEIMQPLTYKLDQNYPNPFNPATKIKYQIPELSFVSIKIYDVLGNEITTLVNEEKPVGNYEVEFYAADLPSGVYFYQLKAGSFVKTKKMVLMK